MFVTHRDLMNVEINTLKAMRAMMHSTPTTFSMNSSMSQIHRLFSILQLSNAFVTKNGILVGVLTRRDVAKAVTDHGSNKKPKSKLIFQNESEIEKSQNKSSDESR